MSNVNYTNDIDDTAFKINTSLEINWIVFDYYIDYTICKYIPK